MYDDTETLTVFLSHLALNFLSKTQKRCSITNGNGVFVENVLSHLECLTSDLDSDLRLCPPASGICAVV